MLNVLLSAIDAICEMICIHVIETLTSTEHSES